MGLNEFPPQPHEGLMTKQPPCAPWPAASFNQGIWHLPKLLGYEEQRGEERKWRRDCRGRSEEMRKKSREDNRRREETLQLKQEGEKVQHAAFSQSELMVEL